MIGSTRTTTMNCATLYVINKFESSLNEQSGHLFDHCNLAGESRVTMSSERLIKVMLVESGEGVGGSAFSLYRLTKGLDKSMFQPHVFVYYRTPVFADIESLGVPVTVLPIYSPFSRVLVDDDTFFRKCRNYVAVYGNLLFEIFGNGIRLARAIHKTGIEIVHCNNGIFDNLAAVVAARLAGKPCISHIRGTEPLLKIERLVRPWLSQIIVLNNEMLDVYVDQFGAEKVGLVGNGVDLDEFKDSNPRKIRQEFSIDDNTFCVGTFTRLIEGKGVPEFLQVAARTCERHDNLLFFVAGRGASPNSDFEAGLRKQVNQLGLNDRIIFAGHRDDVPDCMSAMDLVMQISQTYPEGMSLAPIEAMALAKPVIVSDIAGYENIVVHGETGFVVPAGDIDTLALQVGRLAADRELARRLGKRGYQRVREEFDHRIVAGRVEEVYAKTLRD